jgi:hypothetical protein
VSVREENERDALFKEEEEEEERHLASTARLVPADGARALASSFFFTRPRPLRAQTSHRRFAHERSHDPLTSLQPFTDHT